MTWDSKLSDWDGPKFKVDLVGGSLPNPSVEAVASLAGNLHFNDFPVGTIDLPLIVNDNLIVVKAKHIGHLAVHDHCELWGQWQVSHVPTRLSFMGGVPPGKWTEEQLISWCKRVQRDCRVQWDMVATLEPNVVDSEEIEPQMAKAIDKLKAHCRATPVINTW